MHRALSAYHVRACERHHGRPIHSRGVARRPHEPEHVFRHPLVGRPGLILRQPGRASNLQLLAVAFRGAILVRLEPMHLAVPAMRRRLFLPWRPAELLPALPQFDVLPERSQFLVPVYMPRGRRMAARPELHMQKRNVLVPLHRPWRLELQAMRRRRLLPARAERILPRADILPRVSHQPDTVPGRLLLRLRGVGAGDLPRQQPLCRRNGRTVPSRPVYSPRSEPGLSVRLSEQRILRRRTVPL